SASHAYTPRHATEPRVGRIGAQSVAPPPSATAPTYVPSPGSHCLDRNPAAATLPWCPPPAWVGNHDNTRSTTVVLGEGAACMSKTSAGACPPSSGPRGCAGGGHAGVRRARLWRPVAPVAAGLGRATPGAGGRWWGGQAEGPAAEDGASRRVFLVH